MRQEEGGGGGCPSGRGASKATPAWDHSLATQTARSQHMRGRGLGALARASPSQCRTRTCASSTTRLRSTLGCLSDRCRQQASKHRDTHSQPMHGVGHQKICVAHSFRKRCNFQSRATRSIEGKSERQVRAGPCVDSACGLVTGSTRERTSSMAVVMVGC